MKGFSARNGQWGKEPSWPGAKPMAIPCGMCVGCGISRVGELTTRNLHELSGHEHACFVTLTYSDENLPHAMRVMPNGELEMWPTLYKKDLQHFWKRLRKRHKIRYFACGEYGDVTGRPHYHFILYGYSFKKDRRIAPDQNGSIDTLYISEELSKLWTLGYHTIGEVSQASIEYVARYTLKKQSKRERSQVFRTPIFALASRNPGIGGNWIKKWRKEVYPSDSVIINGQEVRPPRYYDNVIERDHPEVIEAIRVKRKARGELRERNGFFTHQAMAAKKAILEQRNKYKHRGRNG